MKKSLVIAGLAAAVMMSTSMSYAQTVATPTEKAPAKAEKQLPEKGDFKKHKDGKMKPQRPNLDERLKLTEEQKQKAHEIRMDGHKKMKPVFEKMKAKKAEIKEVKNSNMSEEKKAKKIASLKKDLRKLKQEARKIQMENTKQFEAILTPEQKAEFEKIKQEGRERAKMRHMQKHARPLPQNAAVKK